MPGLDPPGEPLQDIVRRALAEDLGAAGDLTANVAVAEHRPGQAEIVSRQVGVLAGLAAARLCFEQVCEHCEFDDSSLEDGAELRPGSVVLTVKGDARGLLAAERTALNFLQRLSGIATRTRRFVEALAGLEARIMDTRKTTPNLRMLEKDAVRVGGGVNHRFGLFDQILLKENHFAMAGRDYETVVRAAVDAVDTPVIAEARTVEEGLLAVAGGAAVVLLDNFQPGPDLASAVAAIRVRAAELGVRVEIEASGGVTLDSVRAFAECGVDRISVGALTHSVDAVDLSMLSETTP